MSIPLRPAQAFGIAGSALHPVPRKQLRDRVAELLPGNAVPFLSTRSAFAALLDDLQIRPGDEVAMSAINIGDMFRLPEAFGASVTPVELHPDSIIPTAETLEAAITERTRAVVISFLFGSNHDVSALAAVTQRAGIPLVIDCAQGWMPGTNWQPPADADVTFLSFGPIKTATTLGGGAAICADADLAKRLTTIQREWPVRNRSMHLKRAAKYTCFSIFDHPATFSILHRTLLKQGRDPDVVLQKLTHGFSGTDTHAGLLRAICQRPDAGLLSALAYTLRLDAPHVDIQRRINAGNAVCNELTGRIPTEASSFHAWWLVPVACKTPTERDSLRSKLLAAGFDSLPIWRSNLRNIGQTPTRLENALLLPSLHGMKPHVLFRLLKVLRSMGDDESGRSGKAFSEEKTKAIRQTRPHPSVGRADHTLLRRGMLALAGWFGFSGLHTNRRSKQV